MLCSTAYFGSTATESTGADGGGGWGAAAQLTSDQQLLKADETIRWILADNAAQLTSDQQLLKGLYPPSLLAPRGSTAYFGSTATESDFGLAHGEDF